MVSNDILLNKIVWKKEASDRYGLSVDVLKDAVIGIQFKIDGRKFFVYNDDKPNLVACVGLCTGLRVQDDASIVGDIRLLDTDQGKFVKGLVRGGIEPEFGLVIRAPLDKRPSEAEIIIARLLRPQSFHEIQDMD